MVWTGAQFVAGTSIDPGLGERVEIYDPIADTWTVPTGTLPSGFTEVAPVFAGNEVLLFYPGFGVWRLD